MYKGAKVRVDAAKVPLRNRTNDVAWARQLVSRAVDVKTGYLGALTAKGTTFAKKFEELTMRLPFAEGDWATLPMNHVLWLYALGCQQEEHKQLYIGLAQCLRAGLPRQGYGSGREQDEYPRVPGMQGSSGQAGGDVPPATGQDVRQAEHGYNRLVFLGFRQDREDGKPTGDRGADLCRSGAGHVPPASRKSGRIRRKSAYGKC